LSIWVAALALLLLATVALPFAGEARTVSASVTTAANDVGDDLGGPLLAMPPAVLVLLVALALGALVLVLMTSPGAAPEPDRGRMRAPPAAISI
jgi:hypothetical protein